MRLYETIIRATLPNGTEVLTFKGPLIRAISPRLAQEWCDTNELGYCRVGDEVVSVVTHDECGLSIELDNSYINN